MANLVGEVGGGSNEAFKIISKGVEDRQKNGTNNLMELGGNIDAAQIGKYLDPTHKALKPTEVENLYQVNHEVNTMVRRNPDDYPEYVKNSSTGQLDFIRQIETSEPNYQKRINNTDYQGKTSPVHLSSMMKSKGNGKFHFLSLTHNLVCA